MYAAKVAETASVSPDAVMAEVRRAFKKRASQEKKKREREETRPEFTAQPKDRSIRYKNVNSAAAEEGVIKLLMTDPSLLDKAPDLKQDEFTSEFLSKVYAMIRERYESGNSVTAASLSAQLQPAEASHLAEIEQKPIKFAESDRALRDYIEKIRTERLKTSAEDLLAVRDKYREKKGYGG